MLPISMAMNEYVQSTQRYKERFHKDLTIYSLINNSLRDIDRLDISVNPPLTLVEGCSGCTDSRKSQNCKSLETSSLHQFFYQLLQL